MILEALPSIHPPAPTCSETLAPTPVQRRLLKILLPLLEMREKLRATQVAAGLSEGRRLNPQVWLRQEAGRSKTLHRVEGKLSRVGKLAQRFGLGDQFEQEVKLSNIAVESMHAYAVSCYQEQRVEPKTPTTLYYLPKLITDSESLTIDSQRGGFYIGRLIRQIEKTQAPIRVSII